MQSVSTEYKTDIEKPIRNISYVRIVFGITNTSAPGASVITDNGHLPYSNASSVDVGLSVTSPYATLENERWILNGRFTLPNLSNPTYQGYVSDELSDIDGYWTTDPVVTINFDSPQDFSGLSFEFDNGYGFYPLLFSVQAFNGGTEVFNETYSPDNEYFTTKDAIPECNKLVLTWLKSNKKGSRARLYSLIYGIVVRMQNEDITECACRREIDTTSMVFPKYEFDFTMLDSTGQYDPENPEGVWEYLEERQPVSVNIGYELDDGNIEWMPWANTYSSGDVIISGTGVTTTVTIKTVGLLSHLSMVYDEGKYYPGGRSLASLATDVMTFAGFSGAITLDSSLYNITTLQPLPKKTVKELLQLIANAGRCVLNVERGGTISILRLSTDDIVDFSMTRDKMLDNPKTTKIPPLRTINFNYNALTIDVALTTVIDAVSITGATATQYTFEHEAITGNTVTVSAGLSNLGAVSYAHKTVVTLSGTGTVTIKGYKLIINNTTVSKTYNAVGLDYDDLENILITDAETALAYMDWISAEFSRRNTYTVSNRGYPELDTGDNIGFISTFLSDINATVLGSDITFNGTLSGQSKLLIINND